MAGFAIAKTPAVEGENVMYTRTSLWLLSSTFLAALLLTVETGTAQTANQLLLRPGLALPPGGVVLTPGSGGPAIVDPASGQQQAGYAHTNVKLFVPRGGYPQFSRDPALDCLRLRPGAQQPKPRLQS